MSSNPKFTTKDVELAMLAKAMSNPARVAILRELVSRERCICGEIVEILPLAQATVSQHLKELKEMGLIKGTVEGVTSCYCINWDRFEEMAGVFLVFFKEIISQKRDDLVC